MDKFDKYTPIIKKFDPAYKFAWQISTEIIEEEIEKKPVWLDIGARNNARLEYHNNSKFGVGLDPESEGNVYRDSNNTFCRGSAYEIPLKDQTFDFITSRFVFEHLEHPEIALAEISRVAKPGCLILLETTNKNNPLILIARIIPFSIKKALIRWLFKDNPSGTYKTYYSINTPRAFSGVNYANLGLKLEHVHVVNDVICESKLLFTLSFNLYKLMKLFGLKILFGNLIAVLRKV